jgi:WD40 repeat protein
LGAYKEVFLWNPTTEGEMGLLHTAERIEALRFSPCAEFVAVATGGEVRLWRYRVGDELSCAAGQTAQVVALGWSHDGILASGSTDGFVRLWDRRGRELARLAHPGEVTAVAWSKDGLALASGASDGVVRLWDRKGRLLASQPAREPSGEDGDRAVYELAWSPDGALLASLYHDRRGWWIRFWDANFRLVWERASGVHIRWSGDSRLLAYISGRDVTLLDPARQREVASLRGHEEYVRDIVWLPDSRALVSGSLDKSVRLWDVDSYANLPRIRGHSQRVTGLTWWAGGDLLTSAARDQLGNLESMFWDGRTGRPLTKEEFDRRKHKYDMADVVVVSTSFVEAVRDGETAFVPQGGKEPIAWFPADMGFVSEDSLAWAGARGPEVSLLRLEGWDAGLQVVLAD